MANKMSFCPECAKNGFPESPSMKDHPLCGDCHDIAEVNAQELAEWQALQDHAEF